MFTIQPLGNNSPESSSRSQPRPAPVTIPLALIAAEFALAVNASFLPTALTLTCATPASSVLYQDAVPQPQWFVPRLTHVTPSLATLYLAAYNRTFPARRPATAPRSRVIRLMVIAR